jgi:DNA modification methylase
MEEQDAQLGADLFDQIAVAAGTSGRIIGRTHTYYRYPARFSPLFAASVIQAFSKPGDTVLDPYMGGGTSILEAVCSGRNAIGNDLNSLAVFITQVKTTTLTDREMAALASWADKIVPNLCYRSLCHNCVYDDERTRNLSIPRGRFVKKIIALAMSTFDNLPTSNAKNFARCAILNAGQWALDGRRTHTTLDQFRKRMSESVHDMLSAMFASSTSIAKGRATLIHGDAATLHEHVYFASRENLVDLVVTSPPYPGVHMLYHRWQVDGRRETPAPYWIAACNDGQGASFYNFGGRKQSGIISYFEASLKTLRSIRRTMREGAYIIQLIAFTEPTKHLPLYLANMESAGFYEARHPQRERIWRDVPSRKWHATLKGRTHSSKEVVLIHRAG